tara:strand:- start:12083 stop:12793 length:711 start_codon:yes stop_codon:yes gene_type:complete
MGKKVTKPVIELKNVWKTYDMGETKVHALRGVSLKIEEGEFVAVVGPSGSGKSTMMHIVGCLDVPSKGVVSLNGRDIATLHESDLAQTRGKSIGFIFQQFNLLPMLTAEENVALPMLFQGINRQKQLQQAQQLLKQLGLRDRMDHKPTELSGGQRQRVAIARALANTPNVVLADEPTGNLDSKTGKEVMEILADLHFKKGKTVILVTHDIDLVKHAERVIYLKDGMIEKIKRNGKK